MGRKLNTNDFILKAITLHGEKYDYTNSIYTRSHDQIEILCKIHGKFSQKANDHLNGCGCPACHGRKNKRTNMDTFLCKAKSVHGKYYDYSKVNYTRNDKSIVIICPIHGKFDQLPIVHLRGAGCTKCRYRRHKSKRIKTTEQFVSEAKLIHGDIYDYSMSKYITAHEKVSIICLKHGEFKQSPIGHILNKHGCPKCRTSLGEKKIKNWLNKNNINYIEQKSFPDCRNPITNRLLKYDFYIPDINLLLEYDGRQHFELVLFGTRNSTIKDLKNTKFRDSIKSEYAKSNGIDLVRIPFNRYSDVENILKGKIYDRI